MPDLKEIFDVVVVGGGSAGLAAAIAIRITVLGAGDNPIPGLYAAGSTGQSGLLLKGHGHHLAWAFVSGRRAGRFAATLEKGVKTQ